MGYLNIKLFQKTQRELAATIKVVIDGYWNDEISENTMIKIIKDLYRFNSNKFIKDDEYTKIIYQQCGKRRLNVVTKILSEASVEATK